MVSFLCDNYPSPAFSLPPTLRPRTFPNLCLRPPKCSSRTCQRLHGLMSTNGFGMTPHMTTASEMPQACPAYQNSWPDGMMANQTPLKRCAILCYM